MARPYQVVVMGATGFTGKLVCEHMATDYPGKLRWAVAGRTKGKLEAIKADLVKIDPTLMDLDLLIADSLDQASLDRVASSADVVITTVGPYARMGLPLAEACANNGTHYCDLTGESNFVRKSMRVVDAKAKETGAKILHCCGFDSVPSDLGALMIVDHFKNVEQRPTACVHLLQKLQGSPSGGTIQSGIEMGQLDASESKLMRSAYALDPPGSKFEGSGGPDSPPSMGPTWSDPAQSWTSPFIMAFVNEQVVRRSNALLGYIYGDKFQYSERTPAAGYFSALRNSLLTTLLLGLLAAATKIPWLRNKLPQPGQGPSREVMTSICWKAVAYGYSQEEEGVAPKRAEAIFGDTNRDQGYWSTSRMLLECALCLILDQDKLEADTYASKCPAGVLTPAAGLGLVLVDRLKNAGYDAEVKAVPLK